MTQLAEYEKSEVQECPSQLGQHQEQGGAAKLPRHPTGRLVIQFLQEKQHGATMAEILRHLRVQHHTDSRDLSETVESILENGTALGFLERKGSHFVNWLAREGCCRRRRRRRSCCRRRIRRRIRRRRRRRRRR